MRLGFTIKVPLKAFLAIVISVVLGCDVARPKPLELSNVFMLQMAPDVTAAAVYLTIKNNSDNMQRLSYAHSSIAEHIEVHRQIYQDGVRRSTPVKHLTLSPQETKSMNPRGFYLMLFGIYDSLDIGSTFDITFEFESGHVITSQVEVRSRG